LRFAQSCVHPDMAKGKKIIIINQAVNYLTIGMANAFKEHYEEVLLMTGSVHTQGELLRDDVKVVNLNLWHDAPAWRKYSSFLEAMLRMWFLLFFRFRSYEVLFVSVPPMAYLLNLLLPNKFSMVIWDVYPDLLKITGMKESHPLYKFWSTLNKKSFRKAFTLITISEVMSKTIAKYIDLDKVVVQPIWSIFSIDDKVEAAANPFILEHGLSEKMVIQYSGNIGLSHKVELLIDMAEILQEEKSIHFQIIGRGPKKKTIESLVHSQKLKNCQFLPFQRDDNFASSLSAANLGVVILDERVGLGSVPSKSYNLMALGIPSLYIAPKESQLYKYALEFGHAKCFSEEELSEASSWVLEFSQNPELQEYMSLAALKASKNFQRSNADKMVNKYINVAPK